MYKIISKKRLYYKMINIEVIMKKSTIKVALIDSGVDLNHYALFNRCISSIELLENKSGFYYRNCIDDANGHGTAIAGIIFDTCPEIEILSIKIFDENLRAAYSKLIEAIRFSINQKVSIINLSLGIKYSQNISELKKICEIAVKRGIFIISAYNNFESNSVPANFHNIFGVRSGYILKKYGYSIDSSSLDVYANGNKQLSLGRNNTTKYINGNSFACAHFSGIIAYYMNKYKKEFYNLEFAKKFICKMSHEYKEISTNKNIWKKPGRSVYFPVNKENYDILLESRKYDYKFVGFYDSRKFFFKFIEYKIDSKTNKLPIYNNLEEALKNADSLFVGDLSFISQEDEREYVINNIVKRALIMSKNVFIKYPLHIDQYNDLNRLASNYKGQVYTTMFYEYK